MVLPEEKITVAGLPDIAAMRSPLIIGIDKWSLETLLPKPYLWLAEPFEGTRATGFIKPGTPLKPDFPLLVLVALDDAAPAPELFSLPRVVFHASEWHHFAAKAATRVSDIITVSGNTADVVKRDGKMVGFPE